MTASTESRREELLQLYELAVNEHHYYLDYGLSRGDFAHILGTLPLVFPDDAGQARKQTLLAVYDHFAEETEDWRGSDVSTLSDQLTVSSGGQVYENDIQSQIRHNLNQKRGNRG